jgi:hypothetical protein
MFAAVQVVRVALFVSLVWGSARADGLVIVGGSPRSIGRAGVGTASDDTGGALLINPAAIARRDTTRVQIGASVIDDAIEWHEAVSAPPARDQSGSTTLPFAAMEGSVGSWVLGAGVMTSTASERAFATPGRNPTSSFGQMFDDRYAGLGGSIRRDTLTAGGARRIGESIAVGASLAISRVEIGEVRALWANHQQTPVGDPNHDVELALDAVDWVSPSAVAGVLLAPPDTHVELAASVAWTSDIHVSGDATATRWATDAMTTPGVTVTGATGHAWLDVRQPITVRTAARWAGERWAAELNGDLWIFPRSADETSWGLSGIRVVDASNVAADVTKLASRISTRSHGAVRGALDIELIEGFLWATGGYAYTTSSTGTAHLSTTFGELGGHTTALGLEIAAGGFTVSLGWARQWSTKRALSGSAWQHDNPFGSPDASIPGGTYDGSSDMVGVAVDAER